MVMLARERRCRSQSRWCLNHHLTGPWLRHFRNQGSERIRMASGEQRIYARKHQCTETDISIQLFTTPCEGGTVFTIHLCQKSSYPAAVFFKPDQLSAAHRRLRPSCGLLAPSSTPRGEPHILHGTRRISGRHHLAGHTTQLSPSRRCGCLSEAEEDRSAAPYPW